MENQELACWYRSGGILKKAIAIAVATLLIVAFSACGSGDVSTFAPEETLNNPVAVDTSVIDAVPPIPAGGGSMPGAQPSEILPRLERAFNNQDIYAMILCFEPSVAETMYAVLELFGLGRASMRQIIPFLSGTLGASGALDHGQWGTVILSEISTERDGDSAMLTYNVHITYADGSTATTTDTIRVVLIDGTWYIATFQQAIQDFDWDAFFNPQRQQTWYNLLGYSEAGDFGDGLWAVRQGNYWGFINEDFEVVIPIMFSHVLTPRWGGYRGFYNGIAIVVLNQAYGIIDTQGNFVVPMSRDYMDGVSDARILTENFIVLGTHLFTRNGATVRDNIFQVFAYNDRGLLVRATCDERRSFIAVLSSAGEILLDLGWSEPFNSGVRLSNEQTNRFTDYWVMLRQDGAAYNAVNMNGELFFEESKIPRNHQGEWRSNNRNYHAFDYLTIYSYQDNMTFAFDSTGSIAWSAEGNWGYWANDLMVSNLRETYDRRFVVSPFDSIHAEGGQIVCIQSGRTYNFGHINFVDDKAIIVQDENRIFYGLFVKNELRYPTEFTRIAYSQISDTFTIGRGTEQEIIRVTAEGEVIVNP